MKKVVSLIIIFVSIFSIANFVNASEGEISDMLDLEYGIQKTDLDAISIKYVNLKTTKYNNMYNYMKTVNNVVKKEILGKIEAGEFDYYTGFDVIKAYGSFIYNVNRLFELYSFKENGSKDPYIDSKIRDTSFVIKTHYKRLQYLVNKD
ncbi:MAG: hypothetical protein WC850_03070 [Candidatus Gracilibacteria bacterium]